MPGWQFSGGTSYPAHRIVPYSPDADALAADVAEDLAYFDARVVVDRADGPDRLVLCIQRRDGDWEFLFPGRQLVIGCDGGWRIEPVPAVVS
jgi:hypothetical protein